MVKQTFVERRRHPRAKRVLSIQFRLHQSKRKNADTGWQLSTTENMAVGGVAFYTDCEYRMGEVLELRIVMSGILDIFNGYGKIVRLERKKTARYYFVAVKFMPVPSKLRSAKSYKSAARTQTKTAKKRI